MAKRSFRVFFTEHDNGKLSGVVIRRRTVLFDEPAPATWGDREEDVLAGLEPALTSAVASDGAERFLFDEELQLRRVAVEVRPKAAAGGAWVLGTRTIPVRIGFAAWAEKETWRIVVPRFGWTLALEDIDDAGDILRHAIFSAMLGDEPASVFDFRPARREWIVPWELPHLSRDDDDAEASADELIPPTVAAVAEDWTLKLRRKLAAPPVGDVPAGLALCAAVDRQPPRSILLVGESGVGKTSLLRRAARHLGEKSKGKDTVPRRLWATSASHITAGMTYLGMWQERCLTLARELGGTEDWLFVDRLVDLLALQVIELTAGRFDLPRVPWRWPVFGSEGRFEQTLASGQDNGLAFVAASKDEAADLRQIFLPFARAVNEALDACGFPLCQGSIMAS